MNWLILFLAGLFEVGFAVGIKYTEGFTKPLPSLATVGSMAISIALLAHAVRSLPLGTAYAIWVGIGAVGTVGLGIVLFGEPANTGRLVSIGIVLIGILALKLTTAA
jgi:quaternary ammonium compound-resistance protein SugE